MAANTSPGMRLRQNLASPGILFMITVTQVPLIFTIYYSLQRWNLLRPNRKGYIGTQNYAKILDKSDFIDIIINTLQLTSSAVVITLVLGMAFALLLNRSFVGKGLVRTMLITPFLIMPTVSAVLWKNVLFNPTFGLFSSLLAMLSLERIDMLANHPMTAVIIIVVWQWVPFMMLILLAGLQSIPQELIEAAQMDGASYPHILRYVIVPHLRRYIETAVLMEVLFILSVFGVIFVTTSGGPGIKTTNLSYAIYQEAFQRWDIGEASAMGIFAVVLANIVVMLFVRVLRQGQNTGVAA
jgi:sorbitol/mannitol transport system permease protein